MIWIDQPVGEQLIPHSVVYLVSQLHAAGTFRRSVLVLIHYDFPNRHRFLDGRLDRLQYVHSLLISVPGPYLRTKPISRILRFRLCALAVADEDQMGEDFVRSLYPRSIHPPAF